MGLPIGHRNGVKTRERGNGIYKIPQRRGIPFYNPAEIYQKQNLLQSEEILIIFTARGRLTNSTPSTIVRLRGSTSMMFAPTGLITGLFSQDITESYKIRGETNIHFWQYAILKSKQTLKGVAWIIFNTRLLVNNLMGSSLITFNAAATLSSYKLRGFTTIVFSTTLQSFTPVNYGLLYNYYAVTDVRNIAASGWHVMTQTEMEYLKTYMGGWDVAGGKMKTTGTDYWDSPNTDATNEYGFNAKGSGERGYTSGGFDHLKRWLWLWTLSPKTSYAIQYNYAYVGQDGGSSDPHEGESVRLVCDSSVDPGFYLGNNNKRYKTVKIGNLVITNENIAETKYRNGDLIPEITDGDEWASTTDGALCAFDNDWNNV